MTDVGGGAASGAMEEVLVPGLAWGMRNVASMITNRREVTVFAQPGEYMPETSRLIRLHIADSQGWMLLGSARVVMQIHNTHPTAPLEFIVPPAGTFQQTRLLSQGTIIDQLDFHSRLAVLLQQHTLPKEAQVQNGHEQFKKLPMRPVNADGRQYLHGPSGLVNEGVWQNGGNQYPIDTAIDEK